MKKVKSFEYPQDLVKKFNKAKKLSWITIGYLILTGFVMYLTMGNSQAMKTAWFDDLLSMTAPISFLIASKIYTKPVSNEFPYGYHRVVTIAYLCSSIALFSIGGFLLLDSCLNLIDGVHPTIGSVVFFGYSVWLGYIMMLVLFFANIPMVFLGRAKVPLAKVLHEKNLYTDAETAKADWMSAAAGIVGIAALGLGWWWADSAAAALVSLYIIYTGYSNLKQAIVDLMNQAPKTVEGMKTDPLIAKILKTLREEKWIKDVEIRLREEGHVFFGEACVIAHSDTDLTKNIKNTLDKIYELNWRIQDFGITPVDNLDENSNPLNKG
jgi:cation diffusion facilitator family transporter